MAPRIGLIEHVARPFGNVQETLVTGLPESTRGRSSMWGGASNIAGRAGSIVWVDRATLCRHKVFRPLALGYLQVVLWFPREKVGQRQRVETAKKNLGPPSPISHPLICLRILTRLHCAAQQRWIRTKRGIKSTTWSNSFFMRPLNR